MNRIQPLDVLTASIEKLKIKIKWYKGIIIILSLFLILFLSIYISLREKQNSSQNDQLNS
jgi:NhaP-type Na+/H+ or K+/H+ antiporter